MFGWDDAAAFAFKIVDKLIPDPAAKAAAALEIQKMAQAGEFKAMDDALERSRMQADVNKVEAGSSDAYTSRWRPTIGYVCAAGLAYAAILEPCLHLAVAIYGHPAPLPAVDTTLTMQLLFGLLGLGGMRTVEKIKDKA